VLIVGSPDQEVSPTAKRQEVEPVLSSFESLRVCFFTVFRSAASHDDDEASVADLCDPSLPSVDNRIPLRFPVEDKRASAVAVGPK
jgi:hypothetical protein